MSVLVALVPVWRSFHCLFVGVGFLVRSLIGDLLAGPPHFVQVFGIQRGVGHLVAFLVVARARAE